jgi:3,4-dihydroxy 2-butanone 4-phosphate synthase/GTP cyclohydrolase II
MFTGIIQLVLSVTLDKSTLYLYADTKFLKQLTIGDSVSIDGVCLTVVTIDSDKCTFELSEETISKTTFGFYYQNKNVNVELALKYGDFIGGHIVLGHVHQIGTFKSLSDNGDMWIDLHSDASILTSYKGSVAINGVSLTVAELSGTCIRIALISETLKRTNLNHLNVDDKVNVEFDIKSPVITEFLNDSYYMRLAITEGEKGKVTAPPNPWVGCVIVKDKNIISYGYHHKAGSPHAEVNAIHSSYQSVEGSTLYITLEPCCHHGRTPPCTELLIKEKIGKVVIGVLDPDERVSGNGVKKLLEAGIEVVMTSDIDIKVYEEVQYSLRQYLHWKSTGIPYVTVKIALSIDNCYRDEEGISKWITHNESRKEGHKLRSECQSIIIGAATVQQDNPELTVRYGIHVETQPHRVVIDGYSLVSIDNKLFTDGGNTTVMTSEDLANKWPEQINKVIVSDLEDVLKNINEMHSLIEGGGRLQKSFFEKGLVNELVIFRSLKVLGSHASRWNIPKNVKLNFVESKIISDSNEGNNIMERYIINRFTELDPKEEVCSFSDINLAIREFAKGNFVLVMDNEDRENEGDLIVAASKMTESQMTEMINLTTGIICVPMERSLAKKLNLPLMIEKNTDNNNTAFTVTVDSVNCGTGVSSKDRLLTVKALTHKNTGPFDLRKPGHIFPLIGHPDGLTGRQGHTEAAIALCKLAEIYPRVAVIGELQSKDGTMKRKQECYQYALTNNIPMINVKQLISAIKFFNEPQLLAECRLKSKIGKLDWKMMCFGDPNKPHKAFIYPSTGLLDDTIIPVRIHSECYTGDVFKSQHCDCGDQLESAMRYITNNGQGVIIFPGDHEGRGIGIVNKVKAYKLQKDKGLNTFEANHALGLDIDARTYDDMRGILKQLNISKINLLTENPDKMLSLESMILKTTSIKTQPNKHNEKYLTAKKEKFAPDLVKGDSPVIDLSGFETQSLKIALVYSTWHSEYITQIRDQLKGFLNNLGVTLISEFSVPGSNEIPFKASKIASSYDGVICIGILIKGDTLHFENVSTAVSNGIMQAQINTGKPMMNCILSCLNMDQLVERVTGEKSTLEYIAKALLYMILF